MDITSMMPVSRVWQLIALFPFLSFFFPSLLSPFHFSISTQRAIESFLFPLSYCYLVHKRYLISNLYCILYCRTI
ncbi:hypothetical protein BDF22DRAFT_10079 [Syncephalis plumigaleata]|nr:hypothetical protein BDF22DRAFT_10079 [Syncephalis plumigaleata]